VIIGSWLPPLGVSRSRSPMIAGKPVLPDLVGAHVTATLSAALVGDERTLSAAEYDAWAQEVRELAAERGAVILAHNYMVPEVQDVAHFTGDSLYLSRVAAETDAREIVFCGVHFMAETAKILSPGKTVLLPDHAAGCSLADSITAEQLREWKAEHPGAVVVSYVNTTAAVKAETDICCTSSNAADVVRSIPADREILFCPDQFLGTHVKRVTGRDNMHIWAGECHVHAGISPADVRAQVAANPDAEILVHPECGCTTSVLDLISHGDLPAERTRVLSTGGMVEAAATTTASTMLVATEVGILHQLRALNSGTRFEPMNPRAACRYMKMITPAKLLHTLRTGEGAVDVDPETASRARAAVEAMIAIGEPGRGGE
jgi:quinolinate synthase